MKRLSFIAGVALVGMAAVSCGSRAEKIDGVETIDLDGTKVTWIRDNAEPRIMERSLFSDAPDSLMEALGLADGVPASVSVFLVEKDGHKLLFDSGLGMPGSGLPKALNALGISPADIDYVFLTHFHGDHIGGMLADGEKTFLEAEIYAPQKEYDMWMAMPSDMNSQTVKTMEAYAGKLHLFGEADSLPCEVVPVPAYGHTPGHTLYRIGKILIVGDLMHGVALQMPHPEICANYDMDKEAAVRARVSILDYVQQEGLIMAGMHFPEPAFIFPEQEL